MRSGVNAWNYFNNGDNVFDINLSSLGYIYWLSELAREIWNGYRSVAILKDVEIWI